MNEQIYNPTEKDRKHCAKCKHHTYYQGTVGCLYILDTGKPRNSQFGIKCDKFAKGNVVQRSFIYSVLDPEVRLIEREEKHMRSEMIGYKGEALKRMRVKKGKYEY